MNSPKHNLANGANKKWIIAPQITEEFQNRYPTLNGIVLQLLSNRGLADQETIDEFLNPDYGQDIHDPFLFSDMEKAVARIFKAIEKGEKIVVYGDYDADGMCSSAVLFLTLKFLGAENLDVYIPDRELEGYGLNQAAVEEMGRSGVNLIITVDCGISNKKEVATAKKINIDVIVTDHHPESSELPEALAIINSKIKKENYPFKDLAGVGVAFKVAQALMKYSAAQLTVKLNREGFEKWLLDLVAIGTVADRMPLLGENRTLVKYGLVVLNKTKRIGLRAMAKEGGLPLGGLDTYNIGFQIGPRLNAAGRFNHASTAYELLITESKEEAEKLARELEQTNQKRQRIVDQITEEARKQFESREILFAVSLEEDKWPVGVVGLVASKLSDEFNRPALVITKNKRGIVGSGRTPSWREEFNLIEKVQKAGEFLRAFGGHAGACGFTLKNEKLLEDFENKLIEVSKEELSGKDLSPAIFIEAALALKDVNWQLFEEMEKFQPFGEDNAQPKFLIRNLEVMAVEKVGQTGKHLRIMVADSFLGPISVKKMIGFGIGNGWGEQLKKGDKIDAVFELGVNEWNGNRELQMKVIDLKESEPAT